jgi:transposase
MNYAGIDVHATYLVVAVVSNQGECVLRATRVRIKEPARLLETLARFGPLQVVVESTPFWPWLHDLLVPQGIGFVLAHAKKLRAIAEADHKSDQLDAELLARMLQAGLIPKVHPKSVQAREHVRLLRHRDILVRERTGFVNRIHGQLHSAGLTYPRGKLRRSAGREWLRTEAWPVLQPEQRCLIESHLQLIDALNESIRPLERRIEEIGGELPTVQRLRTIPGVGPVNGLLLAAELLPISRFPRADHLVGYAGLAPRTRSSGGKTRHGHIPLAANRWVRGALVRTTTRHVRAAPNSGLSLYYQQLKARLGWQVARVAAARKLARAIHAMLRTGEVWNHEHHSKSDGRNELREDAAAALEGANA